MAAITFNPLVENASGRYGRLILRRQNGKVILSLPPKQGTGPVSESLSRVRVRFREAATYSKGVFDHPLRRAPYQVVAEAKNQPVFSVIMTDFLQKPVIRNIDTAGYHGHEGDSINVTTRVDLNVTAVTLKLIGAEDIDLESGAAVFADGAWRYATLTEIPLGTPIIVEVKVTDIDGITVTRRKAIVIA